MLTQYRLTLTPARGCQPAAEWGFYLYSALLAMAPEDFGAAVHQDRVTPVSQFLREVQGTLQWTVNLLGAPSQQALAPVLQNCRELYLQREALPLHVHIDAVQTIDSVDELFSLTADADRQQQLLFYTPTAFKSQGRYVNLPSTWLIFQSLVQKWNGCLPDCPIEDEDGEGVRALAEGLHCTRFSLQSRPFHIKSGTIPGFTGSMRLENSLSGFHRSLANALLYFASFSGIGIKTALGMGGIDCQIASHSANP